MHLFRHTNKLPFLTYAIYLVLSQKKAFLYQLISNKKICISCKTFSVLCSRAPKVFWQPQLFCARHMSLLLFYLTSEYFKMKDRNTHTASISKFQILFDPLLVISRTNCATGLKVNSNFQCENNDLCSNNNEKYNFSGENCGKYINNFIL